MNASTHHQPSLNYKDYIGIVIWLTGILFESIADYQKHLFKQNSQNKGTFIKSGLWSLSRHPNCEFLLRIIIILISIQLIVTLDFGEILVWIGVFIIASNGFTRPVEWLTVISPIFVSFLLINVSGIPLLEKASNKKWGQNEKYVEYKLKTPVLIPFVGRKGDAAF